jgi:hypothetical protein
MLICLCCAFSKSLKISKDFMEVFISTIPVLCVVLRGSEEVRGEMHTSSSSIWCYSPLWALASLITAFQLSLSCAFFHQAITFKNFWGLAVHHPAILIWYSFFLLPCSWVKVNFLQSKLSSILLICPSHFSLFIFIDSTVLGSLNKLYNSSSSSSSIRPSGLLRFHSIFLTAFLGFFSHVVYSSKDCLGFC